MNPNYPQSDDFQGRPRHYDEDEREYRAGQGRFWDEGQQRGRGEQQYQQGNQRRGQWGGREQSWGREQQQWGREQPWNREQQQWGEPSQGEQWGREQQQYGGEHGRYQQDYQQGGRQRYQPYASEQYGQQYGQRYEQQYGQGYDRSRQPYGLSYEESYIGAYPSNASEAWRGEGGWRRPGQPQGERWRQGSWDEPYARRPDQHGQQYGQQYGQQGRQYGMDQARAQQQDYYQQSFRGRGPKGYSRSDDRIKEDICERLSQDPRIDASEVSVECRAGVVMLEGSVEDRATKHRVEDLVDACSGVKDIQNHLTIATGGRDTGEQQTGSAKTAAAAGSTKKQ